MDDDKLSNSVAEIPQQSLTGLENAAIIPALFKAGLEKEKRLARNAAVMQMVVILGASGIVYSVKGTPQLAVALLSGGGVSILNGALLTWRMSRAALTPAPDAHHQLRLMYFYAAERFLAVVTLLALCLVALKLPPEAVISGFVLGQAVLIAARLFLSKFKTEIVVK